MYWERGGVHGILLHSVEKKEKRCIQKPGEDGINRGKKVKLYYFQILKKLVCKLINVQYSVIIMYKERRSYNANNKTNYRFKKYK